VIAPMLREAKNCTFVTEGAWFWGRYVFVTGSTSAGTGIGRRRFSEAAEAQRLDPVLVLRDNGRTWWWFRDSFYWEDDGLGAPDVVALVLERERRKQRRLERAHAAMQQELAPARRREPIPRETRLAVWERDGGRCVECESDFDLQFDHVIPLAMGGATSTHNLQLLCADCNRAKGASL
jgi:5-methylcytosine-specific restriction endonuclease McrA